MVSATLDEDGSEGAQQCHSRHRSDIDQLCAGVPDFVWKAEEHGKGDRPESRRCRPCPSPGEQSAEGSNGEQSDQDDMAEDHIRSRDAELKMNADHQT